jgi:branched-chain amino acid transport system permease protein
MTAVVLPALARTAAALQEAARDARRAWSRRASFIACAFLLGALVPAVAPASVAVDGLAATLYLALAAVGLTLAVGLAGMPSLAQGAFVGVGALVAAQVRIHGGWPPLAAALVGALGALVAGLVVGAGLVRLRAAFVAVATWIVTWLFIIFLRAFPSVSGGAQGLAVPQGELAGISLTPTAHYELALVLLALALLATATFARGPFGAALAAVRQRPPAALSLGIPIARLRLVAFAGAAGLGGLAGGFAVQLAGVFDAGGHGPFLSFALFVAVLLGGSRGGTGAALGALAFALIEWVGGRLGDAAGLAEGRLDALIASVLLLYVLGLDSETLFPALAEWRRRRRAGTPPAPPAAPAGSLHSAAPARLEARGLTKRFGNVEAVVDLWLELEPARITALVGPNGSGKTTALRLLSGTLDPDAGAVYLDGQELPPGVRRRAELGVARTLQVTSIFPESSALENALAGAGARRRFGAIRTVLATPRARREAAAKAVEARVILQEVGLGPQADRPASELSGAEQRILMIASALATRPRVLLLDEPSAGAAPAELERLASLLGRLRRDGLAILLVEHNLRLVRALGDRVIVLDAGRVIADGTADEVAASAEVQAAYLGRRRF